MDKNKNSFGYKLGYIFGTICILCLIVISIAFIAKILFELF